MSEANDRKSDEQMATSGETAEDGQGRFDVDAGITTITINYDIGVVRALLIDLINDLFEEDRPAELPDFVANSEHSAVKLIIEAKRENVTLPDREHVDEAQLQQSRDKYVEKALEIYRNQLRRELEDLPLTYLAVSVSAAVAILEKKELLKTKGGGADLIDRVYAKLSTSFKNRVETRGRGRRPKLTPAQEIGYTEVYFKTLEELQQIKNNLQELYDKGEKDPVSVVNKDFKKPDIDDEIVERLRFEESASAFAHKIAADRFGIDYGRYLIGVVSRRKHNL